MSRLESTTHESYDDYLYPQLAIGDVVVPAPTQFTNVGTQPNRVQIQLSEPVTKSATEVIGAQAQESKNALHLAKEHAKLELERERLRLESEK